MTRPITAGVDGSPESAAAAAWAAREAVRRELPLRLVHVGEPAPDSLALAADESALTQWAGDLLADVEHEIAERHPGLAVTTDVLDGDGAAESLLAAAHDGESLVLGSRGHGVIVGFIVGSVGQQVIAKAERPVVLVRADDVAPAEASGRDVIVGQEGEPEDSAAAMEFAFTTAQARGVAVRAVRAWSLPPVFSYSPSSFALLDDAGGMEPYEKKALGAALAPGASVSRMCRSRSTSRSAARARCCSRSRPRPSCSSSAVARAAPRSAPASARSPTRCCTTRRARWR